MNIIDYTLEGRLNIYVKEDRMQDLVMWEISVKEVYLYLFFFHGIKYMLYEKSRKPPAGLHHGFP